MARVNLEVPKETKEKWEEEADNDPNAGGNLSGFIRSAVQAKINEGNTESDESGNVDEELTELKGMIRDLSESVKSTNARLRELETETKSDPDTEKLANELFARLPTEDEFEEWHSGKGERMKLGGYPEEDRELLKAERGGKPEAFAEVMDSSLVEIQDAISWLRKNTPLIQEAEISGETRLYRER
jgi:hypothetical protein